MIYSIKKALATTLLLLCIYTSHSQSGKAPLQRKDCFFGVHFDFHATAADTEIGKTVTADMIDAFLEQVKPDFVQVDSKGHPGVASFPTKVGTAAGGFTKDALKIWRQETAKYGVGLYAHYSGLLDKAALKKHPNWGVVDGNKKVSTELASVFSNYEDSLMIPQLEELIKNYNIDGVWIDGDTWATQPDYSQNALAQFKKQTGISTVTANKNTSAYKALVRFERAAFIRYVNKYVNQLHNFDKNVEIGTNWLYSSYAPLPIDVDVDFLSGDIPSSQGDLHKVAFDARTFSSQALTYNKPWDLMSWGFDNKGIRSTDVLFQEAAEVIAMGGAWQCYFPQNRDASIKKNYLNTLTEAARFMRARQAYCQHATPVKQIAVLYSGTNQLTKNTGIFQNIDIATVRNTLYALLDNQQPAEIIMEHQLNARANDYPLIVVPELGVAQQYQEKLLQYVSNGGTLLLLGPDNAMKFAKYAGVQLNKSATGKASTLNLKPGNAAYSFSIQPFALQSGTEEIKDVLAGENASANTLPVAAVRKYGKGQIACLFINQSSAASNAKYAVYKQMLDAVTEKLFTNPMVQVTGSRNVHVTINMVNGKTVINLINTKNAANGAIPALEPLTVKLHSAKKLQIKLQPENTTPKYDYANNTYTIQVPGFKIHEMIVAE
ncbi:hypothetical protein FC093_12485 [Ilyomonas limi]|uniref:Glycoside hydrolase family 29 N-terminal domain-containing protein n=1 Tax=Ilyomonas limi TaxID=2575867 RepID=A0A4U3L1E6_9BACT|nr:alpha-amylase family protein [Ilyomonas limi]TKK68024.1 hypothetical protein FC093_12485 [Ilyomonas limi]